MDRPKIVCLCGSTRFADAYRDAMRAETLAGKIVLSVGLLGHQEGLDMDGPVKAMLDELHLRKIDLADEVLVLNCRHERCPECKAWHRRVESHTGDYTTPTCGCAKAAGLKPWDALPVEWVPYVGDSTRREIAYATARGKPIRYLEPMP